jgi:serine phosphatase RsbU (regulator of sigma subunit)
MKVGLGPRTLLAAAVLLAMPAFGSTAAAQLPDLGQTVQEVLPDEPVRQVAEPVQQAVQEPLPGPVEGVVQDSPLAPVREQVRGIVGGGAENPLPEVPLPDPDLPGGGSSGGNAGQASGAAAGGATGSSAPSAPSTGGDTPVAGGGGDPRTRAGGDTARRAGADTPGGRGGGSSPGAAEPGAAGSPAGADARRAAAQSDTPGAEDTQGALARTVERIVEVVPTVVWFALGGLLILALALGARALVDNRRARALRRERERLLRDMGLLERVLLPQVPERLGNLAASVAYRPAAGPAAGGDFYDVFELPNGRIALVVGDVSGHGREALERTNAVRPLVRSHLEAGLTPRAALQAAGRAVGLDESGGFTTVVAAVHDPSSNALTYAAAGHPPPILVGRAAHEPLTLASAPPIGVGLRTGVRQTTVPLPRGSAACFFTDGLLEARRDGSLVGLEWLAEVVAGFGPLDSAEALLDRVVEHADETPDDMTACLIRAVAGSEAGGPRVEELEVEADDLESDAPERFVAACGLHADAAAAALADARRITSEAGRALLTVTIDGDDAAVSVTAPTREALATT